MASPSVVSDAILEDKLIDLWPDYPCLYHVNLPEFKNRDEREKAMEEIAEKLEQTGSYFMISMKNV